MSKAPKVKSLRKKKERGDEVDFLHADKHQTSLQVNTINVVGMASHVKSTQSCKFTKYLENLKKEEKIEVNF